MNEREVRLARTEALFRDVNERIAETAQRFDSDETQFVCECADPECTERVHATLDEYEQVRTDATPVTKTHGSSALCNGRAGTLQLSRSSTRSWRGRSGGWIRARSLPSRSRAETAAACDDGRRRTLESAARAPVLPPTTCRATTTQALPSARGL